MNTTFNPDNFAYFVLDSHKVNVASYGFTSYNDIEGTRQYVRLGKDKSGEDIPKKYKFSRSHRMIRVPKGRKEEVDFLKNHPQCKHSPNGHYREAPDGTRVQLDVWFKELNDDKDATIAVDAVVNRNKAENAALKLGNDTIKLEQVGLLLGFQGKDSMLLHKILQYAAKEPTEFLRIIDSDDLVARAAFKKAVKTKLVIKSGVVYKFKDVALGVDEDEATTFLLKNKELLNSLQAKLTK